MNQPMRDYKNLRAKNLRAQKSAVEMCSMVEVGQLFCEKFKIGFISKQWQTMIAQW